MTQNIKTQPALLTEFPDNTSGEINAQDTRDLIVSTVHVLPSGQTGENLIVPNSASVVPLAVQAYSGQTADLTQWQNSGGSAIAKVNASGQFVGDGSQLTGLASSSVTISTTAPLTGGGNLSANRTLAISAATDSTAGSMSAADKTKLDAATNLNTASTLVERDSSGNFSAGTITANLTGTASNNLTSVATATAGALSGNGTSGSKLAVNVDGSSITINGSNQLVANVLSQTFLIDGNNNDYTSNGTVNGGTSNGVAIGNGASAGFNGNGTIAIGNSATANQSDSISLGTGSTSNGAETVVIGAQSTGSGAYNAIVGFNQSDDNFSPVVMLGGSSGATTATANNQVWMLGNLFCNIYNNSFYVQSDFSGNRIANSTDAIPCSFSGVPTITTSGFSDTGVETAFNALCYALGIATA